MKKNLMAVILMVMSVSSLAEYITFQGQNDNESSPVGALNVAGNWTGGSLPSGSSTGLVSTTLNVWAGTAWNNLAVRQTGGYINGTSSFNLRGGTSGSGITTVYEIDDSRTDYGSYTNFLTTGALTLWSQYGESMELNLQSGHVEADSLNLNASGKGSLNVLDGIFHARLFSQAKGNLNFLSGGNGMVMLDEMASGIFSQFYINFASDSVGSFSVGEITGGGNTQASFEWLVNNGRVAVDGVTSTDWADYQLDVNGTTSTLSVPEPATISMLALVGGGMLWIRRRFVA